jgi:Fe-S cluster biosynthesis and repair protein YggX
MMTESLFVESKYSKKCFNNLITKSYKIFVNKIKYIWVKWKHKQAQLIQWQKINKQKRKYRDQIMLYNS